MPNALSALNYRRLLKDELQRRKKTKSFYSSNAFARDLAVSSSFLCQVLSGKRKLSATKAFMIAHKLSWRPKKQKLFMDLVRYEMIEGHGKGVLLSEIRKSANTAAEFSPLELAKFELISNWYHYAILELCDVDGFRSDSQWIAKKLDITDREAQDAIERLIKLGLLRAENQVLRKAKNNGIKSIPSQAVRYFHRQHLENAKRSLEYHHFSERDFSGTTICTNPQQIEKAKKMIQDFRSELASVLGTGPKTRVYHLAVQLFPLSESTEGNLR
jgi:uncharacterized protein (TIGR02147 family)